MKKYARIYNTPEYRKRYTGIYGSWSSMKQRCNNPKNRQYADYGGRGITYPAPWETFEGFKSDMELEYKKGLTIERINNNKSYSKGNCRWATRQEQSENKRCNVILEYCGQKKTLMEWARVLGIPCKTLRNRYYVGWQVERMLETPKLTYWPRRQIV